MVIDAFIDRSDSDDLQQSSVLLEPSPEFQDRYGLIMASSLSDLDTKVTHKVRMLNPYPRKILINQDTSLGTAEIVEETVTLVESETNTEDCPHPHPTRARIQSLHVPIKSRVARSEGPIVTR